MKNSDFLKINQVEYVPLGPSYYPQHYKNVTCQERNPPIGTRKCMKGLHCSPIYYPVSVWNQLFRGVWLKIAFVHLKSYIPSGDNFAAQKSRDWSERTRRWGSYACGIPKVLEKNYSTCSCRLQLCATLKACEPFGPFGNYQCKQD